MAERKENYKKWIREYWLKNNTKRNDGLQKKLNHYEAELKKCSANDSECVDDIQEKIDWYTKIINSNNKMKEFFYEQLEKNEEKKFEMTAENLELENNLLYYKNHYAKNQLGIVDTTITKDY